MILKEPLLVISSNISNSIDKSYDDISPINLDLNDILQLQCEEERYSKEIDSIKKDTSLSQFMVLGNNILGDNDIYSKFIKYESSNRKSFDSKKTDYIIRRDPYSIVAFKDTRTVLIPEVSIDQDNNPHIVNIEGKYFFEEYDFESAKFVSESVLFPATSCLRFNCLGNEGSISLGYNIGISISPYAKIGAGLSIPSLPDNITIALNYALQYKVTKTTSFAGTHTCNTKNGKAVRLFYKIGTVLVETSKRKVIYDKLEGSFKINDWEKIGSFKYLSDSTPMYYCITDDQMDLKCDEPGMEYIDDDGYLISSTI